MFWHSVGFWSLLRAVLYTDEQPTDPSIVAGEPDSGGAFSWRDAPSPGCSDLVMDRRTSRTVLRPCARFPITPEAHSAARTGDLLPRTDTTDMRVVNSRPPWAIPLETGSINPSKP